MADNDREALIELADGYVSQIDDYYGPSAYTQVEAFIDDVLR